jgi:hypothetical protein
VIAALKAQADKLAFAHTAFFSSEPAEALADFLIEAAGGAFARVYFVSGGSEGIEAALKLARQYFLERGENGRELLSAVARAITATRWGRWPSAATRGGARSSRRC